jgi:hypothetical protein
MLKKKLNRSEIIRIGDRVRIVNPEFFVRCGYPLNKELVLRNNLKQEDVNKIDAFITSFGLNNFYVDLDKSNHIYTRVFDKIADAIAYGLLNKEGFGGRERKIYTEYLEPYKDIVCEVIGRKIVNTGYYRSGGKSYDYYNGGYDYEPASLEDQQTHIIYTVDLIPNELPSRNLFLEIEKKNLEKI